MNKSLRQCFALLSFAISFFQPASSFAAVIESAISGNWVSSTTWVGGIVPAAGDDVVIKNEHTVTLSDSRSCNTVTVESGAVLVLTGSLNNSNTLLNQGTVQWEGSLGTGGVSNNGILNASGFATHNTDGDITNQIGGTINWTDGWFDYAAGGQTLTNLGVFNLIGNNPANYVIRMALVNSGTIHKTTGTLNIVQSFDNQTGGVVVVSSGATLTLDTGTTQSGTFTVNGTVVLNSGSHTFNTNFTGSGVLNITNSSTVTAPSGFAPALPIVNHNSASALNAGTATALTIPSGTVWNWQGSFGAFSSITNNGTLNASGFVTHNTDSDITNNAGAIINWTDGWFDHGAGAQTLTNYGVFNLIGNNPANFTCKMEIVNAGTINKTTGTISIILAFENQAGGVVTVSSGATLTLDTGMTQSGTFTVNGTVVLNGGSHTFNTNFTGSGVLNITNSSTVTAPSGFAPALPIVNHNSVSTLNADAGTALVIPSGTVWHWQGAFGAFSSITNHGTLNASGFVTHNTGADITNIAGGTINWTDGWFDHGDGGQTLTNQGVFNLIGNNPANLNCKMEIVNEGDIYKSTGTLDVIKPFTNQSTGILGGQGTLTFTSTFSNTGVISPGLSPGIVVLNRSAGLQVQDLAIEVLSIGGPGIGHDQLQSANTIHLNGDLTVTLLNGYTPAIGAVFTIMTYAGRTGTFATVTPDCWTVAYGATSATITYNPGTYYADTDTDGYGDAGTSVQACTIPSGYVVDNTDCEDNDAGVNPGATEVCNGLDDDCDGLVDDEDPSVTGQQTWYADTDGDGFGDAAVAQLACDQPSGYVSNDDDCDDSNAAINPTVTEVCNGLDDDCDGLVDDNDPSVTGQPTWYADTDGDGFGNAAISQLACDQPSGYVSNDDDCDDTNAAINPTATEICNGLDDDCDGLVDDNDLSVTGQLTWYADTDGDGFGDVEVTQLACDQPSGYVSNDDDCDDSNTAINPTATEICNDLDDDCDGLVDDNDPSVTGQQTWYADTDGDGFGDAEVTQLACDQPSGYVSNDDDCDDSIAAINPTATEICNGLDDDCDGLVDDNDPSVTGQPTWYADTDSDGFGDANESQLACNQPSGYVSNDDDCDDTNTAINPTATEICNGLDDDCDGLVDDNDPSVTGQQTWYADTDSDGFGNAAISQLACDQPSGYVSNDDDCDDSIAAINPTATEICNGLDDDCDGLVDDNDPSVTGQQIWYADTDGDGFGDAEVTQVTCGQPSAYVAKDDDCDDSIAAINPTATEICNGIDDDCDGQTDEGLPIFTFYADNDGDGFGNAAVFVQDCGAPSGYVSDNTDCDDSNTATHPNASEICNGLDDDCDGATDEGVLLTFYADADNDGFGDAAITTQACSAPIGFVSNNTDCNDSNPAVYPGATEICNNLDDDCDGLLDEDTPDSDGDGFCNAIDNCPFTFNPNQADNEGDGIGDVCDNNDDNDPKLDHQDCAPFNPNIYPGATEICGNLIDDDCDNKIDELLGIQTLSEQDVLCNGDATGAITVTGTCGLPPYTYIWTNGANSATITGLIAGTYKVTVTDAQGLTKTKIHTITQPAALVVTMTKTDVGCFGGANGKATVNHTGGKSPFTYVWSNGGTTKTIIGLSVGAYIVTVTDANGCTKVGGIEVAEPDPVQIVSLEVAPDSINNGKYQITVTVTGGVPYTDGYRYRRCNASGTGCTSWQISNVLSNIPAGNFIVRVKDKNSCGAEQAIQVGGTALPPNQGEVFFESTPTQRFKDDDSVDMRLYPNPASSQINVFVSGEDIPEQSFMEIIDFTGRVVQQTEATIVGGEFLQLDLSSLPGGVYLLRWSGTDAILLDKKFVIVRE